MSSIKEILNSNNNDYLALLLKYNPEVGMIEFNDKVDTQSVSDEFCKIGNFELDIIAQRKIDGSIVLLDHDNTNFVMQVIAKNLVSFLKALESIENFFDDCLVDDSLFDNISLIEKTAKNASIDAGEVNSLDFFRMMFGI